MAVKMKSYRILIVEDELIPASYIKKVLEQQGHTVLGVADTKEEALAYLARHDYPELILMDIKIKGEADGIETAMAFQEHARIAVIYLSAYSDEVLLERAKGTQPLGYLVKPIQPASLLSTIEIGMANFIQESLNERVVFSPTASFDPQEQTIINAEESIALSKYEARLLSTLVKNRNRLISYTMLENSTWVEDPPGEGSLRTTIWRLRKKLPQGVEIENLYSSGYKLVC